MSNPTPTPAGRTAWTLYSFDCALHDSCEGHVDIHDENGDLINGVPFTRSDPRPALIVESVNQHSSLLSRVAELEGALRKLIYESESRGAVPRAIISEARAALGGGK